MLSSTTGEVQESGPSHRPPPPDQPSASRADVGVASGRITKTHYGGSARSPPVTSTTQTTKRHCPPAAAAAAAGPRRKDSKSDDWSEVTERIERRRIQNRIAQRKFREKTRELKHRAARGPQNQQLAGNSYHLPELADPAGSRPEGSGSGSSTSPGPDPGARGVTTDYDELSGLSYEDASGLPYDDLSGLPWGGVSMELVMERGHRAAAADEAASSRRTVSSSADGARSPSVDAPSPGNSPALNAAVGGFPTATTTTTASTMTAASAPTDVATQMSYFAPPWPEGYGHLRQHQYQHQYGPPHQHLPSRGERHYQGGRERHYEQQYYGPPEGYGRGTGYYQAREDHGGGRDGRHQGHRSPEYDPDYDCDHH